MSGLLALVATLSVGTSIGGAAGYVAGHTRGLTDGLSGRHSDRQRREIEEGIRSGKVTYGQGEYAKLIPCGNLGHVHSTKCYPPGTDFTV
jgi:hypothetical protein